MGSGVAKERFERAAKTGILTADGIGLDSWSDVVRLTSRLDRCRTVGLGRNKLRRAVPPEFVGTKAVLSTVTVLDLSDNRITDVSAFVLPPDAPGLVLQTLSLAGNPIAALPPRFLQAMPRLRALDLSGCRLGAAAAAPGGSAALSAALAGGPRLATLSLSSNGLAALPLVPCGGACDGGGGGSPFAAVEVLDLSRNSIARLELTAALLLPALSVLDLSSQGPPASCLRSVSPALFGPQCPQLCRLELGGNDRKAAILDELRPTEPFRRWSERHAATIGKLIAAGGAELME